MSHNPSLKNFSFFLSVVLVVRNQSAAVGELVSVAIATVAPIANDYEIIIVDNASTDDTLAALKRLTGKEGQPNLQVYALTKAVDIDTACWVGVENALGDFVATLDSTRDDVQFLPELLICAENGIDVVFARNKYQPSQSYAYRICASTFNYLYKHFNAVNLAKDAPMYRLLSKRVVNFILQHPLPVLSFRHLPATAGFTKSTLTYHSFVPTGQKKNLADSLDRGMRLLVSTTQGPMRLVTLLSLSGAIANIVYSFYVILIGLFKEDVAAGWVSLSLQQSGMFFLLSLVLLVLGEYILNMVRLSSEGPAYHVAQEFTSERLTRKEKLNIESVSDVLLNSDKHLPDVASDTANAKRL